MFKQVKSVLTSALAAAFALNVCVPLQAFADADSDSGDLATTPVSVSVSAEPGSTHTVHIRDFGQSEDLSFIDIVVQDDGFGEGVMHVPSEAVFDDDGFTFVLDEGTSPQIWGDGKVALASGSLLTSGGSGVAVGFSTETSCDVLDISRYGASRASASVDSITDALDWSTRFGVVANKATIHGDSETNLAVKELFYQWNPGEIGMTDNVLQFTNSVKLVCHVSGDANSTHTVELCAESGSISGNNKFPVELGASGERDVTITITNSSGRFSTSSRWSLRVDGEDVPYEISSDTLGVTPGAIMASENVSYAKVIDSNSQFHGKNINNDYIVSTSLSYKGRDLKLLTVDAATWDELVPIDDVITSAEDLSRILAQVKSSDDLLVVELKQNSLSGTRFNWSNPGDKAVCVNVFCDSSEGDVWLNPDTWYVGSHCLSTGETWDAWAANVIWNFVGPDGEPFKGTVHTGRTIKGTFLLPDATFNPDSSSPNLIIADHLIQGNGELHKVPWQNPADKEYEFSFDFEKSEDETPPAVTDPDEEDDPDIPTPPVLDDENDPTNPPVSDEDMQNPPKEDEDPDVPTPPVLDDENDPTNPPVSDEDMQNPKDDEDEDEPPFIDVPKVQLQITGSGAQPGDMRLLFRIALPESEDEDEKVDEQPVDEDGVTTFEEVPVVDNEYEVKNERTGASVKFVLVPVEFAPDSEEPTFEPSVTESNGLDVDIVPADAGGEEDPDPAPSTPGPDDSDPLESEREKAREILDEIFNSYDEDDYSDEAWDKLESAYQDALSKIEQADDVEDILEAVAGGITGMAEPEPLVPDDPSDDSEDVLEQARDKAHGLLDAAFSEYDESDYDPSDWNELEGIYKEASDAIDDAESIDEIMDALVDGILGMEAIDTLASDEGGSDEDESEADKDDTDAPANDDGEEEGAEDEPATTEGGDESLDEADEESDIELKTPTILGAPLAQTGDNTVTLLFGFGGMAVAALIIVLSLRRGVVR